MHEILSFHINTIMEFDDSVERAAADQSFTRRQRRRLIGNLAINR